MTKLIVWGGRYDFWMNKLELYGTNNHVREWDAVNVCSTVRDVRIMRSLRVSRGVGGPRQATITAFWQQFARVIRTRKLIILMAVGIHWLYQIEFLSGTGEGNLWKHVRLLFIKNVWFRLRGEGERMHREFGGLSVCYYYHRSYIEWQIIQKKRKKCSVLSIREGRRGPVSSC